MKTCTVCKVATESNYCSNCGQLLGDRDTTMGIIVSDFFSNLFSVEKSVFACLLKLLRDPKMIVENYWKGNRKYYPSPGRLFFYSLAIAALHVAYVNPQILGFNIDFEGVASQVIFWILFLPVLVYSSFFSFWKLGLSVTKHLISIMYIATCFFMIVTVVSDSVFLISGYEVELVSTFIFFLLVFTWNARVFTLSNSNARIALNALFQFLIFLIIVASIMALLYYLVPVTINENPE